MPVGVLIGVASALLTALITEVYAHRCLAHHAFRVHPAVASVLETYFRVIVGTDPGTWAAVHRLHHRYADTPLDPHSPVLRPPLAVLAGSPVLFAQARRRVPPGEPRGRGHIVIRLVAAGFFFIMFGAVQ
ncbi:MAG: hypothetical protein ACRD12_16010, partial [Acidimicrobiales bacterium]